MPPPGPRELPALRQWIATRCSASLERIRNGTYGTCVECGDNIVYERFDAYPTAKRCMTCQSRHENRRGGRDATPSL